MHILYVQYRERYIYGAIGRRETKLVATYLSSGDEKERGDQREKERRRCGLKLQPD